MNNLVKLADVGSNRNSHTITSFSLGEFHINLQSCTKTRYDQYYNLSFKEDE
jgi:hypothetical protein